MDSFWFKKLKEVQFQQNLSEKCFSLSKPKVVYLRPFLSSLSFSNVWKQILMFFGRKHLETEQCFLHELTCFLKYDMSLIIIILKL